MDGQNQVVREVQPGDRAGEDSGFRNPGADFDRERQRWPCRRVAQDR